MAPVHSSPHRGSEKKVKARVEVALGRAGV